MRHDSNGSILLKLLYELKYIQSTLLWTIKRKFGELCLVWNGRVGSPNTTASAHKVQLLFNDLGLYPTSAQVSEMMQCTMKCANRSSPAHMTFGEFCILARKLKNGLDRGIPRSVQFSRLLEKDQEKHNGIKRNLRSLHNYEVFLGGSCNPTTWRKDVAIPFLLEAGISFYNPQVDHWSQDLIEIEFMAKENASILFYVIDRQTRNVVSAIEAANFVGSQKNLVMVIHPQDTTSRIIVAGEQISSSESCDIDEALAIMYKITHKEGILVFENIPQALNRVVQIIHNKISVNNDVTEECTINRKVQDAFNMFDTKSTGQINIFDVRMAIRLLTNKNLSEDEMLKVTPENNDSKVIDKNQSFNFDQFKFIALKYFQLPDSNINRNVVNNGYIYNSNIPRSLSVPQSWIDISMLKTTDIYLAGDSGDDIRWKEDIAIPLIKKTNLTYQTAKIPDLSVLLDSRTLLFVIPYNSRSLSTMILAAYCIGKSCRTVLCIQNLNKDSCTIHNEKLTQTAINDYNRGRLYLADLASREQVPVFESIEEAVEIAIHKTL
ncbi:uncharacterized protein LOC126894657 isoform X2 [Daktulosphaira vitifoliae]|uniref:uncharacterized protein LOC126894657 isoform X2 n=1 Tax=Daktulosphaira vitifoliae TaxID=58002 RepID=UPI0021AAF646|nr:uncharacterized protein LOC126894657 isoform X2 [Daktulosphaira vitifoliae]